MEVVSTQGKLVPLEQRTDILDQYLVDNGEYSTIITRDPHRTIQTIHCLVNRFVDSSSLHELARNCIDKLVPREHIFLGRRHIKKWSRLVKGHFSQFDTVNIKVRSRCLAESTAFNYTFATGMFGHSYLDNEYSMFSPNFTQRLYHLDARHYLAINRGPVIILGYMDTEH